MWLICKCMKQRLIISVWALSIIIYLIILSAYISECAESFVAYLPENLFFFTFADTVLNGFGIFDYENLLFKTSLGGAKLVNGELICGFINLAKNNPASKAALYLCAKAVFVFSLCGICLSKLHYEKEFRKEILIISLCIVLTGNPFPALLLLFICDRKLYFLSLCFVFLSCVAAKLADKALLFTVNPSVFELLLNSTARAYHLALLAFAVSVSYYLSRLVTERLK